MYFSEISHAVDQDAEFKEFFMPGRICLVGEHSDWAAISEYNKSLQQHQRSLWSQSCCTDKVDTDLSSSCPYYGLALICPTDQGIHIRVREDFITTTREDQLEYETEKSNSIPKLQLLRELNFTFETENTTLVKSNRLVFTLRDLYEMPLSELLKQDNFFSHVSDVKFYSYMIGILKEIFSDSQVVEKIAISKKSLYCHNYKTTLPMGKGVSSSAAICVLIARIFNQCYNLNWSVEKEIEIAFLGERSIGSECGKLDHACAYGDVALCLSIRFNSDSSMCIEKMIPREKNSLHILSENQQQTIYEHVCSSTTTNSLTNTTCSDNLTHNHDETQNDNFSDRKIYMLLIDLNASKDTVKILKDLNKAFSPSDATIIDAQLVNNAREYLLVENVKICQQALDFVEQHNAHELGKLFSTAQNLFDRNLSPLCPSELTAPILHSILHDVTLQELTYGGKGVGSGGDGSCLVCCKGSKERDLLRKYLENTKGMSCLDLTL
ncbi:hypothetical protein C9374_007164 [Naegleria lovaniensis]|uniref:GHMP kinase N-terminal domain-containing protein n=1 Tax=Naegleria lovaniensis TaxID=51637 RepID=A0AA88GZ02_NAELO|nr:uncharacterized protein C9374_007164 [Naegleria lovaniensis]KAG2393633.1 hypothetical protein C9374_007164 [Naegleria lovaniensis]